MTTYNTGNPIGSTAPQDLYDNAQALDEAVNSAGHTFTDRLGQTRKTYKGIEAEASLYAADAATSASNAATSATGAANSASAAAASAEAAETALLNLESNDESIQMDGAQSAGARSTVARGDHRHPTDTSRAPLDSPDFTGTPTAPTASPGTNNTQLATTEFVQDAKPAEATQAEMEAGTESGVRSMSPLNVAQAIAAKSSGGIRGQVFTATGNFTVPDGVTAVKVRGCSGGGGAAGTGTNGGTTSFGSYCSATGGMSGPNGGTGGVATGGDINIAGGVRTASGGGLCGGSGLFGGGSASSPATGYGNGGFYTGSHGGGGGYFERYITGLTPGDTIAVTIGAGGFASGSYQGTPGICVVEW